MKSVLILATGFSWTITEAGSNAAREDHIFFGMVLISAILIVALLAMNLTFLVRYRRGSPVARPPLRIASWKIEACWIAGTTAGFLGIFFWGEPLYLTIERPPPGAEEITVAARQWMWDFRQPNGRREFDTLHVPVGQPIRLALSSEDVIHSFFVPAFRYKQDVVPGKIVTGWFEAIKPGTYRLLCTQYCGTQHARMGGEVIALPPEQYAAWLNAGGSGGDLATRGRRLFVHYGCAGCHTPGSSVHAPSLEGVYQSRVPLQGGGFARADSQYLLDSILEPKKQIVAGYQPVMPSFKGEIPEGDLIDLVSYLKTLRLKNIEPLPPAAAPRALPYPPPP